MEKISNFRNILIREINDIPEEIHPVVSVCMITYNHEQFIAQAIEGVLMQKTDFPIELVIGEDCSTDRTREICLEYQKKYPHLIRLLLPKKNLGMMPNFINTLKACRGEYIALCEGDDYWIDNLKIQKQYEFILKNKQYTVIGHGVIEKNMINKTEKIFCKPGEFLQEDILYNYPISTLSAFFRLENKLLPEWFEKVNNGDLTLMLYLLCNKNKGYILNEIMGVHIAHENGVWHLKKIEIKNALFHETLGIILRNSDFLKTKTKKIIKKKLKTFSNNKKTYSEKFSSYVLTLTKRFNLFFENILRFNPFDIFKIICYKIVSKILQNIPKTLISSFNIIQYLQTNGFDIKIINNQITFDFFVNDKKTPICLEKNTSDPDVFMQIMINKEYQYIIDLFYSLKIIPQIMIDAGANIGLTTLYFKRYFSNLSVYLIEPSSKILNRLKKILCLNKLDNVYYIQKGLWSSSTYLKSDFSFRDGQDWSHRLVPTEDNSRINDLIKTITVNELMQEYELEIIDFFKMDIEGAEAEVFSEKADISWLERVKIIAIEIHDEFNCRQRIENILISNHFHLLHNGELTIGVNTKLVSWYDTI